MKVRLSPLLLVMSAMCAAAFAQTTVAGKWTGELPAVAGRGAAQPITVDLKLEGETLSGTVAEGALETRPIVGAAVAGANVTFRTVRNLGAGDINVNWKGEIKGDDMTLTREIGPAPPEAGGGRGGGGGARGGGGRGTAAPAAGGQRGGDGNAAAAPIPAVPGAAPAAGGDAAGGGRGAGGGGGRGAAPAAPAAAGGAAPAQGGGRGAAAPTAPAAPNPSVTLNLRRAK